MKQALEKRLYRKGKLQFKEAIRRKAQSFQDAYTENKRVELREMYALYEHLYKVEYPK